MSKLAASVVEYGPFDPIIWVKMCYMGSEGRDLALPMRDVPGIRQSIAKGHRLKIVTEQEAGEMNAGNPVAPSFLARAWCQLAALQELSATAAQ